MVNKAEIMDHAQVTDKNGIHVGVVDHLEGDDSIKLVRNEPEAGGIHHIIPLSWVDRVDDNKVILKLTKPEVEKDWKEG
ncbi:DUF2171 domain-containing protein [Erwinia sp. S43]|uniref:DUF2171 domain-containing protein n=1 Tax=Pantoea coffeiphila TaxID=1465635 RepID=A0A2S9I727_9GAMM|nr:MULTISPECIES: DUF2171 domain-containing protein [Erwiniaceae]MBK0004255.1 DUF2171 domain-containing protein [Erwinia sp. S38]MBK0035498.1 DUF2171 domain-containing protein [Erwinia sp. S43]PRD13581.1 hypothetical protein CQW29_20185 [Pantoea coffeiphila]